MNKICDWPMSLEEFTQKRDELKKKLQKRNNVFVITFFGILLANAILASNIEIFLNEHLLLKYCYITSMFLFVLVPIVFVYYQTKFKIKKFGFFCPQCKDRIVNNYKERFIISTGKCSNCGYRLIVRKEGEVSLSDVDHIPSQTWKQMGKCGYVKQILTAIILALCFTTQIALMLGGIMFFKTYPLTPQWLNFLFTSGLAFLISFFMPVGIYFKLSIEKRALQKLLNQNEKKVGSATADQ